MTLCNVCQPIGVCVAKVSRALCMLKPGKSTVSVAPPAEVIINPSSDCAVVMITTSDTYTAQAAITAPAANDERPIQGDDGRGRL